MSQLPPGASSNGWQDPYGTLQPGSPPPGYWQANDGRWYPPNPVPGAQTQVPTSPPTQAVGPDQVSTQPAAADPFATQVSPQQPSQQPGQFAAPAPGQFAAPAPGPDATQVSPPGFAPPPNFAPPTTSSNSGRSKTALYAILGVIAFLFVGCSALGLVAISRAGDTVEDALTTSTSAIGQSSDGATGEGADSTGSTNADGTDTTVGADTADSSTSTTARSLAGVTTSSVAGGGGSGDAVSCTVIDDETIVVEVVNSAATIQSYFLTIAFFEGDERLGDSVAFVNNLRPGERTIEESFIFDQEGSRCEVEESDGFSIESDPEHVGDISPCEVTGVDSFGDVTAELTATNSSGTASDYTIQVAFVGADGVRRGTGFANVEAVAAGGSAPTEVFTLVDDEPNLVCEVVGVDRTDS